jgi:hypothetical protein
MKCQTLINLLEEFVEGKNQSPELVARIEESLLNELDHEQPDAIEETLTELLDLATRYAQYPAQNETHLYGPEVLEDRFKSALAKLTRREVVGQFDRRD